MIFEPITENSIQIALEIVNSNPDYNVLENGNPIRTLSEVSNDLLNSVSESFLVVEDNRYIGIVDFLENNPKDNKPWLGLLMINGSYHSLGYGKRVYGAFEEKLKQRQFKNVRIGVLQDNLIALTFWKSLGFKFYGTSNWREKVVDCFEKQLM
ncbi:GNAT family N-acetyltransferase [Bacillus sp. 7586-K]|uniref:GNAT family N-acetyltransferase n=1 Tax=Metabacillus niabensis TaxID=324854 RepID=UPI000BA4E7EE|nr:GNAT family N-acetyltransferase [Bacillus sp. 7586-K]